MLIQRLRDLFNRRKTTVRDVRATIEASGMFDAEWYLKRYPDVAAAKIDPLTHFLEKGADEGRAASLAFSTRRYLEEYPDVAASGLNALYHYVAFGQFEGRSRSSEEIVRNTRARMLSLGFVERGYNDMAALVETKDHTLCRPLAARELVYWHLRQNTPADADKALAYLAIAAERDANKDARRNNAILAFEAHLLRGDREAAQRLVDDELAATPHPDLYLAAATIASAPDDKAQWINRALRMNELANVYLRMLVENDSSVPLFDRLRADAPSRGNEGDALITILMPVYNAAAVIDTAIRSICAQTWRNFELLVIDDCSTDTTRETVERWVSQDRRIRLIRSQANAGPYVARNIGLKESAGEFVTCHDSDDWSHPQKLEIQALHLMENPTLFGNQSTQARTTVDLQFFRRGNHAQFIFSNMSSLMFRRERAQTSIGFWDSVRFGADHEFIRRAIKAFGPGCIATVRRGPLSFQRQTPQSLTGNDVFGFHGYYMGARQEYYDRQIEFHRQDAPMRYEFPQTNRPFPVPELMRPQYVSKINGYREFDVVIASDFRMRGGSTLSNAEEIKAMTKAGLRVGLVQMSRYDLNPQNRMQPAVVELVNEDNVQTLVYGEKIRCALLIVRYPPILQDWQRFIPEIEAQDIRVIVNQPPVSHYGEGASVRYDIERAAQNLRKYFGKDGVWHPIGPAVREALMLHHAQELGAINLSPVDWVNIVDVAAWRRTGRPTGHRRPHIGRHARDDRMKWPPDRSTLLKVYPNSDRYQVSILGGASIPEEMLGGLPANWTVLPFNSIPVKDYLAELDVFLYYTHPQWIESFGRVIIEAMAVGVPVIIPPSYQGLFEDAALYAEPDEALLIVDRLMADPDFYDARVRHALTFVERRFGHAMHVERVGKIIAANENNA